MLFPSLLLLAASCSPDSVIVEGQLYDSRAGKARPAVDAFLRLLDADGAEFSAAQTDRRGRFTVAAPFASTIHLVTDADNGFESASFTGASGTDLIFEIQDDERPPASIRNAGVEPVVYRVIYGMRESERADWETTWAGCPRLGEGGTVIGEVSYDLWGSDGRPPPAVEGATARLTNPVTGESREVCYLNEDGTAYDAAAVDMGATQAYALFGVAPGPYELQFQWEIGPNAFQRRSLTIYVPENGVVPRYPVWLPFPVF